MLFPCYTCQVMTIAFHFCSSLKLFCLIELSGYANTTEMCDMSLHCRCSTKQFWTCWSDSQKPNQNRTRVASPLYFLPAESWCVTVHIYNYDLGSQRHVTQPEPSWLDVTNEKQPKSSSLLYNWQMLWKNIVTEAMKPLTSEHFIFKIKLGQKKWICVPFGNVYLFPGVLKQVPR